MWMPSKYCDPIPGEDEVYQDGNMFVPKMSKICLVSFNYIVMMEYQ